MSEANIKRICPLCKGVGTYTDHDEYGNPLPDTLCRECNGDGGKEDYKLDTTEIMDDLDKCKKRLKKIMDKLEITD